MSEVPNKAKWWHPETKTMSDPLEFLVGSADKIPRVSTGLMTQAGEEVFDEDIVAAKDNESSSELIIDRVHWEAGAWRLGKYEGCLADFFLVKVESNTFEKPWPVDQ